MKYSISALLALILVFYSCTEPEKYDIVILDGNVIDGSGGPSLISDIGISDGKISFIGELNADQGISVIQAQGMAVTPGFIDVHGHIESSILRRPEATNLLFDGVTTMITGNCGGSRVNLAEYFQQVLDTGISINLASLIGHNSVRRTVMGTEDRDPSDVEMQQMSELIEQAMKDGAVGLSTGLLYIPGTFAETEEIVALAKVIAPYGGVYSSHIRLQDHRVYESIEEAVNIGKQAEVPVEISHIKIKGKNSWGGASKMLEQLNGYISEGLEVSIDQYPYTAASTGLSVNLPSWSQAGGNEELNRRLETDSIRDRIKREMRQMLDFLGFEDYSFAYVSNCPWNAEYNGKSIPEIAVESGMDGDLGSQIELILEMMTHGQRVQMIYHYMGEEDVQTLMKSPLTMIASDGGIPEFGRGSPHPRSYGTNARVLSKYVRELNLLSLEEAVRKMTSYPAMRFGLEDRGTIEEGKAADILVFNSETINDLATFESPHAYSQGISHVIVNGKLVVEDSKPTGERSGQVLRGRGSTNSK